MRGAPTFGGQPHTEVHIPRLNLHVSEELASEIATRAEALGISISRFLADVVRRNIGTGWPEGYFENGGGGWRGEPLERAVRLDLGDSIKQGESEDPDS